ncbi:MAG: hypothetical protein AB2693_34870 [Candidatus Thiodiazotropha sp.]
MNSKKQSASAIEYPEYIESSKCIKCGKNCHKRAAFCEKTLHWIHYRCDRLSPEAVHAIENDPTYKYECQLCLGREVVAVDSQLYDMNYDRETYARNDNEHSDSRLLNGIASQDEIGSAHLNDCETEPKTLAESILDEEISLNICYSCEEDLKGCESLTCELCNAACHLTCLKDTENGMVCNACKGGQNQLSLHMDSEDDMGSKEGQDKNSERNHDARQIKGDNSLEKCLSYLYHPRTQDAGCQTEGASLIEFSKKQKELSLKEKNLNKKELELSQTSKQLITARTKVIALEKSVSELQKENDLLRTNLLLVQTGSNKKLEESENAAYIRKCCSESCNCKSSILEQRISMLEHEQLKNRIERLEVNCGTKCAVTPSSMVEEKKTEERELKRNLSKLIEAQQEMLLGVQSILGTQTYNDSNMGMRNLEQSVASNDKESPVSQASISTKQPQCEKGANMLGRAARETKGKESQPTVITIQDETSIHHKDVSCWKEQGVDGKKDVGSSVMSSDISKERKRFCNTLEGVPIQYQTTATPHPFLYPAWTQQAPPWTQQMPWMGQPSILVNNLKNGVTQSQRQQHWPHQRRVMN